MKKCSKCKDLKEESEFYKESRSKDRLTSCCKDCKNIKYQRDEEIKNKICKACLFTKEIGNFEKDASCKSGYRAKCKQCQKEKIPILRDTILDKIICNICNEDLFLENFYSYKGSIRKVCKKCHNRRRLEYNTKYNRDNRELVNKRNRERYKNKSLIKLKSCIRSSIQRAFNTKNKLKVKETKEILRCSFEEFKQHIESQFLSWMSWDNYGNACETLEYNCSWDLDHVIPISYAKTEEEMYLLNHWSNFQPLCSKVNRDEKKANIPTLTNLELKITII